jgi:hypothetical protein
MGEKGLQKYNLFLVLATHENLTTLSGDERKKFS